MLSISPQKAQFLLQYLSDPLKSDPSNNTGNDTKDFIANPLYIWKPGQEKYITFTHTHTGFNTILQILQLKRYLQNVSIKKTKPHNNTRWSERLLVLWHLLWNGMDLRNLTPSSPRPTAATLTQSLRDYSLFSGQKLTALTRSQASTLTRSHIIFLYHLRHLRAKQYFCVLGVCKFALTVKPQVCSKSKATPQTFCVAWRTAISSVFFLHIPEPSTTAAEPKWHLQNALKRKIHMWSDKRPKFILSHCWWIVGKKAGLVFYLNLVGWNLQRIRPKLILLSVYCPPCKSSTGSVFHTLYSDVSAICVLSSLISQRWVRSWQDRKHQKGHSIPGTRGLLAQRKERPQRSCEYFFHP